MCFLTDLYGGFPPQQQFQTLTVVGQAAVVQRCAAFDRLLVQIQTAEGQKTQRGKNFKSKHRGPLQKHLHMISDNVWDENSGDELHQILLLLC